LPLTIINTHLNKEVAALVFAMIGIDAMLAISGLGQEGTVLEHLVGVHDMREQMQGVEGCPY
jgi:hypothetical protein